MQVLLTTDNHIAGGTELTALVESIVVASLGRFGDQVTRVEVHLSDENSAAKQTEKDKRCLIEARLGGMEPVAVRHMGATLEQALEGAAEKLEKTLDRKIGRLGDRKGRASFGDEPAI